MIDTERFREHVARNLAPENRHTPYAARMMADFFRRDRTHPQSDELADIVMEVARGMGIDV